MHGVFRELHEFPLTLIELQGYVKACGMQTSRRLFCSPAILCCLEVREPATEFILYPEQFLGNTKFKTVEKNKFKMQENFVVHFLM